MERPANTSAAVPRATYTWPCKQLYSGRSVSPLSLYRGFRYWVFAVRKTISLRVGLPPPTVLQEVANEAHRESVGGGTASSAASAVAPGYKCVLVRHQEPPFPIIKRI